jgi:benzoate membrane transport protein
VSLFAAFPVTMVAGLAGLALLSTIAASLHNALATATYRDAALMTFLVTASGVNMFHISSAFWGVVVGIIVVVLTRNGNN